MVRAHYTDARNCVNRKETVLAGQADFSGFALAVRCHAAHSLPSCHVIRALNKLTKTDTIKSMVYATARKILRNQHPTQE